ncbi:hypothetical protein CYY_002922 [Polysphondylium violaceum]|uniref:Protein-lysine N-methyltransferase SMYD4 n=1 Tax=Polysphondylium violaceum TaxID=133409 RepID=A0A8J4Q0X6_9MYCE|nr:hypothetical protein CYY_002922 [Polysphondylium violaceum]
MTKKKSNNKGGTNSTTTTTTTTTTTVSGSLFGDIPGDFDQQANSNSSTSNNTNSNNQFNQNSSIYKSKLARLSRNIPPISLFRESTKKIIASKFETSKGFKERVQIFKEYWDILLENRSTNLDTIINSTTGALLLQYVNVSNIFNWEQTSKGYKNKGNELFQKKQYHDALLLYSEALRLYNSEKIKDPQILSSIYSNRCLCLVNLEKYDQGAIEATRGIECGAANHLIHKLLYRRGICYFSLKRFKLAKKDFEQAHKLVSKMDSSDLQSIETYLEKISKMNLTKEEGNGNDRSSSTPTSTSYPSLVDSRVEFKYQSESTGRMAEAKEDIESNTILFQETAYVSCIDKYFHTSHCHYCFKEILAPIYCTNCNFAQYCGDSCLHLDLKSFHEPECNKGFLNVCSSETLLVLRLLRKKTLEQLVNNNNNNNNNNDNDGNGKPNETYIPLPKSILENVDNSTSSSKDKKKKKSSITEEEQEGDEGDREMDTEYIMDKIIRANESTEAKLMKSAAYRPDNSFISTFNSHFADHSPSKLVMIMIDAFVLERFLNQYYKEFGIPSKDYFTIETLVTHLCQLSSYVYSIPVFITAPVETSKDDLSHIYGGLTRYYPVKIAYAIFPMASLLNHSCDNNTMLQYNGRSITIKSLKDIEKGAEITACYGPYSFHSGLRERLISLKEEYFFTCRCNACSAKAGPNPLLCPNVQEKCSGTLLESINTNRLFSNLANKELTRGERLASSTNPTINGIGTPTGGGFNHLNNSPDSLFEDYENRNFSCNKCGVELSCNETNLLTSKALMADSLFEIATKSLIEGDKSKDVGSMLFRCLEVRLAIYQLNSRKVGEVYDALARYYIAKEKYKEAVVYAEKAVNNIYIRMDHSHSTDLAREWAKLANIYINAGEPNKAIKAIDAAEILLSKWKTEPGDDEILVTIRNHKKVLEASKVIPGTNKVEINLSKLCSQPDFDSNTFLHKMISYHQKKF